ncbi:MAG TPA: signal peptidase I [Actinomycetes bacterium]|nr:signal peptidase I [Actinomycetes bacterium]
MTTRTVAADADSLADPVTPGSVDAATATAAPSERISLPAVGLLVSRAAGRVLVGARRLLAPLAGDRARRVAFRLVIGAFVAAILVSYSVPLWYHLKGEQLLVVTSGSMQPTVREGDAVVVHPISPTELRRGMVVTFWTAAQSPRRLETHRIVDLKTLPVTTSDGHLVYDANGQVETRQVIQTKGDGNAFPDPNMTPVTNVRGVVVAVKTGWGRQLLWAHSGTGRLLLFGPPLLMLLGAELLSWRRVPRRDRDPQKGARDAAPRAL